MQHEICDIRFLKKMVLVCAACHDIWRQRVLQKGHYILSVYSKIKEVLYFHHNCSKNIKSVIFCYTRNFLNPRGYYSDHLYERSNDLRRSIFFTGYSSHLFSSYTTELIFLNKVDNVFFVVGMQCVYFETEDTFPYIIFIHISF